MKARNILLAILFFFTIGPLFSQLDTEHYIPPIYSSGFPSEITLYFSTPFGSAAAPVTVNVRLGDGTNAHAIHNLFPNTSTFQIWPGQHATMQEFDLDGNDGLPGNDPVSDLLWSSAQFNNCLLYTSPSPRDQRGSRMPSSA